MKKFKNFSKNLLKKESGQGATEYILLLVVVVALVFMFKGKISSQMEGIMGDLSNKMGQITGP